MYIWRIRPEYKRATRGYYASTLIDAFVLARADFPKANVLYCESSDPGTGFAFPATMTYRKHRVTTWLNLLSAVRTCCR